MKPLILLFIVSIFFISSVNGLEFESYSANYNIISDTAIVEIDIEFKENITEFSIHLPYDANGIEVPNHEFIIKDFKTHKHLTIKSKAFEKITIKFISSITIEKAKNDFFILDLSDIESEELSITLKLPEQATLKYSLDSARTSIIPKTNKITTDGKQIQIQWNEDDLSTEKSILVIYTDNKSQTKQKLIFGIGLLLLMIISFLIYYFYKAKTNSKTSKNDNSITKNLFEEEKLLVNILLKAKNQELWQKQLEIKSKLSAVKLTRKLRNLEEKEIIEKIPYGNSNKIRLKNA
jgi:uncharacterized membrane protein